MCAPCPSLRWYDYAIFVIIFLNCIQMALESPFVEEDSHLGLALYWSDVAFTIVFGIEVLVKSFAFTFKAYIKDGANQVRHRVDTRCSQCHYNWLFSSSRTTCRRA